jgi:hypothetical protein
LLAGLPADRRAAALAPPRALRRDRRNRGRKEKNSE